MAGLETEVKFFHKLKNPKDAYVSVGWFDDQTYYDGTSIAKVAKWNEFGTKQGVPQRPFLRTTIAENQRKWDELLKTLVQRALDEDKSIDKAMLLFGEQVKADIQDTILAGGWKPNAKITQDGGWMRNKTSGKPFRVKGKGGKSPLIDTGTMLRTIEVRIDE